MIRGELSIGTASEKSSDLVEVRSRKPTHVLYDLLLVPSHPHFSLPSREMTNSHKERARQENFIEMAIQRPILRGKNMLYHYAPNNIRMKGGIV